MPWTHIGGGCLVGVKDPHPCDDTYEEDATGERVTLDTSMHRHFAMPETADTIEELRALEGVQNEPA